MKKFFIIIFTAFILIYGCNSSKRKNVPYSKDGISFSLPKYWKIKKDRPIEGLAHSKFISISNEEPFSKDGFLIITAVDSVDLTKTLDNLIAQSRTSYARRKIEFSLVDKPKQIAIGDKKALRADFETRILTTHNKGSFTVLQLKHKTFTFTASTNVKDKLENFAVVDSVIKSLQMK